MRMTGTKNPKTLHIQKATLLGCFFYVMKVPKLRLETTIDGKI